MATELATLLRFLDQQRRAALTTVERLAEDDLRRPVLPSGWTCLGMLQHLTVNERYWLRWAAAGEQIPGTSVEDGRCQVVLDDMADVDNDWVVAPHLSAEIVIGRYRDEVERSNAALASTTPDSPPGQRDPAWNTWYTDGGPTEVRWIALHMIEETARHAGHLDVVRELLDSRTAPA